MGGEENFPTENVSQELVVDEAATAVEEGAVATTAPSTSLVKSLREAGIPLAAWASFGLASVWLIVSIILGISLINTEALPTPSMNSAVTTVESSARHQAYGGDAYTGIQNAAADTANAVVDGSNAVVETIMKGAGSNIVYSQVVANHALAPLMRGIGFLVISIGVVGFIISVGRLRKV